MLRRAQIEKPADVELWIDGQIMYTKFKLDTALFFIVIKMMTQDNISLNIEVVQ